MTDRRPAPTVGVGTLAAAALVVAVALRDGGVGPDAAANLRAAWWLAEHGTLDLPAATPTGRAWFATWPPGYPALVALPVALGVDPWAASKGVGVASLVASSALLRRLVPEAPLTPLLGLAAVLHLFAWSASEGPFVVALLGVATALVARRPAAGGLAATAAVLLRYVGVATLPVLAGAAVVAWRRGARREAAGGVLAALTAGGALAAVLGVNTALTGHATGMPRVPAPEAWSVWGLALGRGLVATSLPTVRALSSEPAWIAAAGVGAALLGAVVAVVVRTPRDAPTPSPAAGPLVAVGAAYLVTLVGLRAVRHFDLFPWRLLAPGTLLVAAALAAAAASGGPLRAARVATGVRALGLAGAVASVLLAVHEPGDVEATRAAVARRHAEVPSGCVVGPHDLHLPWVRPDLVPAQPLAPPYDPTAESIDAFRARLLASPHPCVRLDPRAPVPAGAHPSWRAWADGHPDGALEVLR